MMTTVLAPDANELQAFCALPTEQALPRAAGFLADLVQDRSFLESHVLPALEGARDAERWYVARRWDAPGGSFSLQVFVWPPGTRTMIHDHSSWGAYACAAGTVLEERYERLDDGSRHEHARLREVWQLPWSPRDGASTVQPGDGGIHRVGNPYEETALSVHLYGPRLGEVDGRDYDPSRDSVCDRLEDQTKVIDEIVARGRPVRAYREVSTFTVINTNDSGAGSLRQAIIDANATATEDVIEFDIPGSGVKTIAPATELPQITSPVTTDGYTQTGAQPNTKAVGSDAALKVELSGASAPSGTGLYQA